MLSSFTLEQKQVKKLLHWYILYVLIHTMKKGWLIVIMALAVIGIGLSGYLSWQHLQLKKGQASESACDISAEISCTNILRTHYSEIASIPLAGLGLIYYLFVLGHVLTALSKVNASKAGLHFCLYLSVISIVVSCYLAYVSAFVIAGICPFCVGMYAVNLSMLLAIPLAMGVRYRDLAGLTKNYVGAVMKQSNNLNYQPHFLRHSLIAALFFAIGIGALYACEQSAQVPPKDQKKTVNWVKEPPQLSQDDIVNMHFNQAATSINPQGRPLKGNASAKVTIVEFSDFECPFCKKAAEYFKEFMQTHNDIAFYHLQYPLDKSCNPHMKHDMHKNACLAARAALCTQAKGRYWEMHDLIFDNQKQLNEDTMNKLAGQLGLDAGEFTQCLAAPETNARILADIEEAKKAGITGTPAVFLNGRKVQAWTNTELLETLIKKELNP